MSSSFEWTAVGDCKAVVLKLKTDRFSSEMTVAPDFGANLLRFCYNGKNIIDYNPEVLQNRGFTGTPVMFPTPNRVFNSQVTYNGRVICQMKNGEERLCHGLVYDEPFEVAQIVCNDNEAYIDLALDINPKIGFFDSFPFESRLHIIYSMDFSGLEVKYIFENLSSTDIQYGFGIHPYFNFAPEDRLVIESENFLELENMFPTGKILKTDEVYKGINKNGVKISELALDTDFARNAQGTVRILNGNSTKLEITASQQFRHFMVYRGLTDSFICIEPQTCSINAHNLAAKGFKYANILNIAPHQTDEGYIKINVVDKI